MAIELRSREQLRPGLRPQDLNKRMYQDLSALSQLISELQAQITVLQAAIGTSVTTISLVSPYNPGTRIVFDVDGGITIQSPVQIRLKNTTSGDTTLV